VPRRARIVIALTLYSRPGCHLCDVMKDTIKNVAQDVALTLEEVDISTDPALEARYGLEIPVLLMDGKRVAKYRIAEEELMRVLRARV
jgi:thiol-disulfide isomerase/thioredoxin